MNRIANLAFLNTFAAGMNIIRNWMKFLVVGGILLGATFLVSAIIFSNSEFKIVVFGFTNKSIQSRNALTAKPVPMVKAARATGPLTVNPDNPRYFSDGSGKAILLVGDHTWYTLQDSGISDPPQKFDYDTFLNFLQANHVNFFRMFVWEQAKWSVGVVGDYYYFPLPYTRSGPGNGLDGKPKFDLSEFNQEYFDRLRQRVIQAGDKGIYVSIQLFEGFSVSSKPFMAQNNPWPGHPFNQNNNINGINGDANGNGEGEEIHTLQLPKITAIQEAYVKKIIDTVNDLDNVLFEISNESNSESEQWQYHMINVIKDYEFTLPKQHPVGMTIEWPGGNTAELFESPADWISPNADYGYFDDPPSSDGSKVIINDTDHLHYPDGDRQWMWRSFFRGLNPAFMDPYDCKADWSPSGCEPNNPTWVSLRRNLGYALNFSERVNLVGMTPLSDLCSSGYCLANPSEPSAEYLVYLPAGSTATNILEDLGIDRKPEFYLPTDSKVTVDLSATHGELFVEWFNPETGETLEGGTIQGGQSRSFTAPFGGDAVLYLYQEKIPRKINRILIPMVAHRVKFQ